jgi:glyoxylase I family protein
MGIKVTIHPRKGSNVMIKQIAHICLQTRNLQKTLTFYKNALNLKVHFRFIREGKVFGYYLGSGKSTYIEIFENKKLESTGVNGALKHLCFEVASIKAVEKNLIRKKIKHTDPKLGADNSWQLWVEDPNGIPMEFHQYTKKSSQKTKKDCVVSW